jgi:hypothetical protein
LAGLEVDALNIEAQQAKVEADRQGRIAEHKLKVVARGLHQRDLAARAADAPLNMFAEGDSWFDYPLTYDTIGWLRYDGRPEPEILSLAHYGDMASKMLGVSQRQRIIKNLQDPDNGAFDAILFSGGGNDLVGDQFVLWVTQYVAGADPAYAIDAQRLADILGVVNAAYIDLIKIRDSITPNTVIFLHAYDFAQPNGQGVCRLGPWLKPSLDFRGWTDFANAARIVTVTLQSLDRMLVQLEQQHANVVYVRTQGTLTPATDWTNELHPTEPGFNKIAQVFLRALQARFPGRI